MKKSYILSIIFSSTIFLTSCNSAKKVPENKLSDVTWQLEYITGPRIAFDGLYPEAKPEIKFNFKEETLNGNTSCNPFRTSFKITPDSLTISETGAMTMRFCPGGGEETFLKTLYKINSYRFDGDGKLILMMDDLEAMKFHKK